MYNKRTHAMDNNIGVKIGLKDEFTSGLRQMSNQLNQFKSQVEGVNTLSKKMSSGGGLLSSIVGGNLVSGAITTAFSSIANGAMSAAKYVFDAYTESETYMTKLTGMLGGNEEKAKSHAKALQELAKTTPFNIEDLRKSDNLLLAYGFRLEDTADKIRLFGDVAAGVASGGTGDLSGIIAVMGQIRGKGKADTRDLYQFAERGIPIFDELAKATGKSVAEVQKLTEQGMIGEKEVTAAFKNMTGEGGRFYKAMELQSRTINGRMSNIMDSLTFAAIEVGESLKEPFNSVLAYVEKFAFNIQSSRTFKSLMSFATTFFNTFASTLQKLEKSGVFKRVDEIFSSLVSAAEPFLKIGGTLISTLMDVFTTFSFLEVAFNAIKQTGDLLEPVITMLGDGLDELLIVVKSVMSGIREELKSFTGGISDLLKAELIRVAPGLAAYFASRDAIRKKLKTDKDKTAADELTNALELKTGPKIDTITSQAPKVVTVNILTGDHASLVDEMSIVNNDVQDARTLSERIKKMVEEALVEVLNQGTPALY